ncbi:amino acid ABC transporter membrane protein 1, PAAT family [Pseudovibrio denitrificans]|uniref:Amino acid ABC transporter membrane protein 1, PAAT family n=1 Tax=Pseudovibrio denitrificans TaxID=258256 RepID=A0A1I7DSF9_9HYPH|nr:amino acid ABC transporter permease [Pseudovibrio denitrificans]SFU14595.1 amino acid ABC transporter membrane protein 1, PAAT family [Pseudovibrio denitrificans]
MFGYSFHWRTVWQEIPQLAEGAIVTLQIAVFSMLIGITLAVLLAVARRNEGSIASRLASVWIEVARNTPCLLQIYLAYFGLGALGINISSYAAVLGAIAFNNAGYLAEILRGGFNSISQTQYAAAHSLGMNSFRVYSYVVLPQVFRVTFRPIMNQSMWALLNTSLGMVIGLKELTGATQFAQSRSFRTFEFFLVAAAMYYVIAKIILGLAALVQWRFLKGGR